MNEKIIEYRKGRDINRRGGGRGRTSGGGRRGESEKINGGEIK